LSSNDSASNVSVDRLSPKFQINLLNNSNSACVRVDNYSRKAEQGGIGLAMMATLGFCFTD
jgi:hypothetical protein